MRHVRLKSVLASLALTAGACALLPGPASATTSTGGNPWTYQATSTTQDGLVVQGAAGTGDPSLFIVKDHLGQPIFNILAAGGAAVMGDDFRVMAGSDIFHGQITVSASNPNPAVCVRAGQLWIGGPAGDIWRCANLGGGYAWWPALS